MPDADVVPATTPELYATTVSVCQFPVVVSERAADAASVPPVAAGVEASKFHDARMTAREGGKSAASTTGSTRIFATARYYSGRIKQNIACRGARFRDGRAAARDSADLGVSGRGGGARVHRRCTGGVTGLLSLSCEPCHGPATKEARPRADSTQAAVGLTIAAPRVGIVGVAVLERAPRRVTAPPRRRPTVAPAQPPKNGHPPPSHKKSVFVTYLLFSR